MCSLVKKDCIEEERCEWIIGKGCRIKSLVEAEPKSVIVPLKHQKSPSLFRFTVTKKGKKYQYKDVLIGDQETFKKNPWKVITELANLTGVSTEYKTKDEKEAIINSVRLRIKEGHPKTKRMLELKEKHPEYFFIPDKDLYGFEFFILYLKHRQQSVTLTIDKDKKNLRTTLNHVAKDLGIPHKTYSKMKKKELQELVYSKFDFEQPQH